MTFLKWLAGFLLTLVLLILVAVIVIPMVVDPNDYREEITNLVKQKTGRDLALNGDLEVSVFPWLGIRTQGLTLSQPDAIGGDMVSVSTAQLRVKLVPLLSKRVEVDTVVLEQPQIRLVTLKNGTDSFSGLAGDQADDDAVADAGSGAAVALVVQGLELTDGTILIDDRQAGSRTEISNMNLVTGNLIGDILAPFDASGQYNDGESPAPLVFELEGLAKIDTETLEVSLADIRSNLEQNGNAMSATIDAITMMSNQDIELAGLSAKVQSPQSLELAVPSISVSSEFQNIVFGDITAKSGDLTAIVKNLVAKNVSEVLNVTGQLSIAEFDAAKLLKSYEIDFEPADKNALRSVSVESAFSAGLDEAKVTDLTLILDQSTVTGSASIRNFEQPAVQFNLDLDTLNLDHYLPADDGVESTEEVSGGEALAVPMAVFKMVNANGQFKAGQFISGGIELTDIDVRVKSANGDVEITPAAKLYDGQLAGNFAYKERDGQAQLQVNQQIDLVQVGKLLTDADVTDQLSGLGSLGVDVVVTEKDGVQSNEGVIKLFAKEGALSGIDMSKILGSANTGLATLVELSGRTPEPGQGDEVEAEKNDVTEFGELLGTFNLKDNRLTNDDLKIDAPGFQVTGFGEIDAAQQTVDYNLRVKVGSGLTGELDRQFGKLAGYTIPIRCRGSLEGPSCLPDMNALYSLYAKTKLDEKKGEYLQEKLGIEGGEKLSTKEALKQALLQRALRKDKEQGNYERPIGERNAAPQGSSGQAGDQAQGASSQNENADDPIPDVPANPDAPADEPQKSEKEQLKDDLKKKLLEGLFN